MRYSPGPLSFSSMKTKAPPALIVWVSPMTRSRCRRVCSQKVKTKSMAMPVLLKNRKTGEDECITDTAFLRNRLFCKTNI
jgi:hypothetical protein